jgi:hypothetical protein
MFIDFVILLSLSRLALADSVTTLLTVSIQKANDFLALRTCAASCVEGLPGAIGCLIGSYGNGDGDYYNTCFCNSGFIPQATSYLGSCISSACSDGGIDYPAAVTVYEGYCITAGYPMGNVAQPTAAPSVVSSTVTAANGQASTVLFIVTPTGTTETQTLVGTPVVVTLSTVSLGSPSSQSTPANTSTTTSKNSEISTIVGGAVGGVLILGIAATVITWMILREQRKRRAIGMNVPPTGPIFSPTSNKPSAPMRSKPEEGLISRGLPSPRPFVAASPVPARTPVPKPADPTAGLIPSSPTPLPSRLNSIAGPPGYNEHAGREISEFVEPVPEMQGVGSHEVGHWEMQG